MDEKAVENWTVEDVKRWMAKEDIPETVAEMVCSNRLDGPCILSLNQQDFSEIPLCELTLREKKVFLLKIKGLQRSNHDAMVQLGLVDENVLNVTSANVKFVGTNLSSLSFNGRAGNDCHEAIPQYLENDVHSRPSSDDGRASKLKPEIWKAFISLCYVFFVTWINAVVMVIVHDKVPDMNKYPPLPDLFLDNVPHIAWAFDMCEIIGSIMMAIWVVVLLFHKHRFIVIRRFFALAGTVFLLRCITMMITSLSVPGSHLKCAPRAYPAAEAPSAAWGRRLEQAYEIWAGAGMSVRGVRTCGDYMFSGHTVALTLLNFFITEYTTRSLYILHIVSWLINMFGIFFILAAHEHYSIDVFIAFYITSRLFLYYHTLSNNQALVMGDSMRTRIWFPLLSFFESEVDGIVPNEYESPLTLLKHMSLWCVKTKDTLSENTVTWLASAHLARNANPDFSVSKLICNLKENLNTKNGQSSPNMDKNIQACLVAPDAIDKKNL